MDFHADAHVSCFFFFFFFLLFFFILPLSFFFSLLLFESFFRLLQRLVSMVQVSDHAEVVSFVEHPGQTLLT